ncbi:MAG TPA: hypothetical protein VMT52_06070 [Planctomycetota bacterium]|nr:hypothetical protein [Planctomycetota bacterium]
MAKSEHAASRGLSRREFLALSGLLAAGAITGCSSGGGGGGSSSTAQSEVVFRLSSRGRRTSNAAKLHNANMLFLSQRLADANRAHVGDHSRIVAITLSGKKFDELFRIPKKNIVDLRKV